MLWSIRHTTSYRYSSPVSLESHTLRLTPASDATQRLQSFELVVAPAPWRRAENVDVEDNSVTQVWFEDRAESLSIETAATVETLRANPFDYWWEGSRALPVTYQGEVKRALERYMAGRAVGSVGGLADTAAVAGEGDAQAFPLALAEAIHESCRQIYREEGAPLPAVDTLSAGEGSCRDLVQVFLEASRSKGFAARFVSGYIESGTEGEPELHAWAEVYLPGGGWRGFDPTIGLATAERHVALARGAVASLAAPVSGSYRGRATSTLTTSLRIEPA